MQKVSDFYPTSVGGHVCSELLGKSEKENKLQIFLLSDILTSIFPDSNIFLCSNSTLLQRRLLMVKSFPAGKEKCILKIEWWQCYAAKHLFFSQTNKTVFLALIYNNYRKMFCKSELKLEDCMLLICKRHRNLLTIEKYLFINVKTPQFSN